ncbi:MAG: phosphatidylserine/phosphatidylglycerophosphate/cardiolipin synthase family protein [Thermoanaerobaculia bacterium]
MIAPQRSTPRRRSASLLLVALLTTGCTSLLSEKRTTYRYEPDYGVDSPEFRRSLEALGTEMVAHNRVKLLQNGDAFFPAMLQAIRSARRSINMEMYIFDDGRIGTEFAEAMAERARAGVQVRLLVDGWGSDLGVLDELLRKAGAKVRVYRPLRIYSIYKIGSRTHRKILTVDGQIGFCGGLGIDDRWLGNARNPREWRETMIQVQGPVVAQLQAIFMEDWVHTTGEVIHGDEQFPPTPQTSGGALAQAVPSSKADASSRAKLMLYMAIQAARSRIWIENAYFVPDRQIRRGLLQAVRRGVDVKVVVPGQHIDIPIVRMASRFFYGELLDGGVQIYEYRPTMMHNKVMVVDGIWATIGSINFVNRSMRKNAEANVAVYDRGFASQVEEMIRADIAVSERFTREQWEKRGALARLSEAFFWIFSENY